MSGTWDPRSLIYGEDVYENPDKYGAIDYGYGAGVAPGDTGYGGTAPALDDIYIDDDDEEPVIVVSKPVVTIIEPIPAGGVVFTRPAELVTSGTPSVTTSNATSQGGGGNVMQYMDSVLEFWGQAYNQAKAVGDTAKMEEAHNKAEAYRKTINPGYTGSADGSAFSGPAASWGVPGASGSNNTSVISTGNNVPVSGGGAVSDIVPEYSLIGNAVSDSFSGPLGDVFATVSTVTSGISAVAVKIVNLTMYWLPWVFLALFITRIAGGKASVKAGPLSASAGR